MPAPTNFSHIVNNPACEKGIGCLFKSINDVGNGYPFLTLFLMVYIVSTYAMVSQGNSFKKSIMVTSFIMLMISIISIPYDLVSETILIGMITITSSLVAFGVYATRRG